MHESWFFGKSGLHKLKEINDAFKLKTIDYVNSSIGSQFSSYSPWMSYLQKIQDLKEEFLSEEFLVKSSKSLKTIGKLYAPVGEGYKEKSISFSKLTDEEYRIFYQSIELLESQGKDIGVLFKELVHKIVPLHFIHLIQGPFQGMGIGFSTHLAKGAIFLSVPSIKKNTVLQLAVNMAHETGHQSLYIYQNADPIIDKGMSTPVFSHVRKINRPAIQSFHATVALAFMVRFLTQLKMDGNSYYHKILSDLKEDFIQSLDGYESIQFTEVGQLLFEDLKHYANQI